jgi:hypothetical protein
MKNTQADIVIPIKYYPSLTKTFSPIVLDSLIESGSSKYLCEVLKNSGITPQLDTNITVANFLDLLFSKMSRYYQNEYVYKNAIANKILLGKHTLDKSYMLTEFRVDNCRADVVVLNGTSHVYEIKSEFDTLDRINKQVESYMKMFAMVNVITSSTQIEKVRLELPSEIGLMELTSDYEINTIRESVSIKSKVKPEVIFEALRKKEYLKIIKNVFGYVPDVPNTRIFHECRELFSRISPIIAHDEMVKVLLARGNKVSLRKMISCVPESLKAYVIDRTINESKAKKFEELLERKLNTIVFPV